MATRGNHWQIVLALLLLLRGSSTALAQSPTDPLVTLWAEHPRLLFLAEDQQRIEQLAQSDDLLARLIEQNQLNATEMLGEPSVRYEIPDGKRLLGQSRECIRRVLAMALAYRLSGDERFAQGAVHEMLVAADFKDWNPSHFLDTAEMTTGLALGYDWLYDTISPQDRHTIRAAIVRQGLREGQRIYGSRGWWTVGDNNWNQVCNGGMILGSLAIAEDERELASEIVRAALRSIPRGLSVYEPSGAYPEGPGYWQYGTEYTCLTIKALTTALGSDFDVHKAAGLAQTGWYRIHTIGPTGFYFNYADGGMNSGLAPSMFMLADVFHQPALAWWHRGRLEQQIAADPRARARRADRFFPLEIAWYDPRGQQPTATELPLAALFKSRQDIVTMRGQWGDPDAVYVGFKAGDNETNHGHLDIGSFVLDAEGIRWALDMGADDYNLPGYFGQQRWRYYRLINHSHNTLVINDQIQNPHARCHVLTFESTPARTSAIVDMTSAYQGQAAAARRGIELLGGRLVHVRDELEGVDGTVRWGMVTAADVVLAGNTARLTQGGKTLLAKIIAPADGRFEILPNTPPTSEEKQNDGTRILAVQVAGTAEREGRVEMSVVLQPITADEAPKAFEPLPLAEWPGL
jgi:hypothetical protein